MSNFDLVVIILYTRDMNTEEKRPVCSDAATAGRPFVGVGVIVVRDGKVLMGKRAGSHGENTWMFLGGYLEFGETIETCARRELKEETGLIMKTIKRAPYTNDMFTHEEKHHITLFVIVTVRDGEPKIMEPDKCLEWRWCDWDNLPEPLFLPVQNLKKNYPNFNPIIGDANNAN